MQLIERRSFISHCADESIETTAAEKIWWRFDVSAPESIFDDRDLADLERTKGRVTYEEAILMRNAIAARGVPHRQALSTLSKIANREESTVSLVRPMPDDASRALGRIRMPTSCDECGVPVHGMKEAAARHNIALEFEDMDDYEDPWLEDSRIVIEDGAGNPGFLISSQDADMVNRAVELEGLDELGGYYGRPPHSQEVAAERGLFVKQAQGYYEGGDVLVAPDNSGVYKVILGSNMARLNHRLFQLQGIVSGPPEQTKAQTLRWIAEDFGVTPSQVVVLNQGELWHIDMFVRPGPRGVIMVSDLHFTFMQIAQHLAGVSESKAERYYDAPNGLRRIDSQWTGVLSSVANAEEMQQTLQNMQWTLARANFTVEPIIGAIPQMARDPRYSNWAGTTNYANGIMGTPPGASDALFITNAGDEELNQLVATIFSQIFAKYGQQVEVEFIRSYLLSNYGGLDCITNEFRR